MQVDSRGFLETALRAVKKAEPIFRKSFGRAAGAVEKDDPCRSPVTDVDKEIEKVIAKELSGRFPDHSISGEEFPLQDKGSRLTWYIDPIDGTVSYIRGLPFASISLGLWEDGAPLLGVVSDPMTGTTYSAVRGQGAFKNMSERLAVSKIARLSGAIGIVGRSKAIADDPALQRIARSIYRGRGFGGGALELCLIAEGKLDFSISEWLKIYDFAAAAVILTEAGGKLTNWQGESFGADASNLAASNGLLHEEILATLAGK